MEAPINVAEPPFDPSPRGDLILRSTDGMDFYIMKAFLIFDSPVFQNTLLTGKRSCTRQTQDGLDLLRLDEDSSVIRHILFCYPGVPPKLENLDNIVAILRVAEKYEMEALGKKSREILVASPFMKEDPLRVFSLAFRYGWEAVGTIAAQNTLAIPQRHLRLSEELSYISGLELDHLTDFRYRCAEEIRRWIFHHDAEWARKQPCGRGYKNLEAAEYVWLKSKWEYSHDKSCTEATLFFQPATENIERVSFTYTGARQWWVNYFTELLRRLEVCPNAKTVLIDKKLSESALVAAARCPRCAAAAFIDLPKFKKFLAEGIIQVIARVRHPFSNNLSQIQFTKS